MSHRIEQMSIGEDIARRRKELKLSQVKLSGLVGINRKTLIHIENGGVTKTDILCKILEELGLEIITTRYNFSQRDLDLLHELKR